jgi:hypothetical protein
MASKVKTTHPEYDKMLPQWSKCCDVIDGTRALREKTTEYLPKLEDETDASYKARLNRTTLYNATYRTIVGFLGMLFRKPPVFHTESKVLKEMSKDVTQSGVSLNIFALELCEDVLATGRVGIWTNYPVVAEGATLADTPNARPSLNKIEAKDIYNWSTKRTDNQTVLSMVRIAETIEVIEDEFTSKCVDSYRILDLDPSNGLYRVRLFTVNEKQEDVLVGEPAYPKVNGMPMTHIPFVFVSPDDTRPDVDEPPFIDLMDTNLAHYQFTADYAHGCHWSGIPTVYVTGHTMEENTKLEIGGGSAMVFPAAEAKVGILEVGTQGFSALEKMLDRLESQMIILGARLLEVAKPGIEAAETAMIHRSGEQSILASMAGAISEGVTIALSRDFAPWAGESSELSYEINREFFNSVMTPQMLTATVASWQAGAISDETKFQIFKKGEIYTSGQKFEDEQAAIVKSTGVTSVTQSGGTLP